LGTEPESAVSYYDGKITLSRKIGLEIKKPFSDIEENGFFSR